MEINNNKLVLNWYLLNMVGFYEFIFYITFKTIYGKDFDQKSDLDHIVNFLVLQLYCFVDYLHLDDYNQWPFAGYIAFVTAKWFSPASGPSFKYILCIRFDKGIRNRINRNCFNWREHFYFYTSKLVGIRQSTCLIRINKITHVHEQQDNSYKRVRYFDLKNKYSFFKCIVEYLNLAAVSTFNLKLYLGNLPKTCTCIKNSQICDQDNFKFSPSHLSWSHCKFNIFFFMSSIRSENVETQTNGELQLPKINVFPYFILTAFNLL
ncbi:hypothetical protein AGLY_009991 [Aphis glycines]|uniref:Uncharacterized protein n=1 Tax=Aphis glycines TaxID=307491 RepID=A0A6G0TID2_APHGL|nr:hypothetical protein AGLY_009991 [Aphis glycines]